MIIADTGAVISLIDAGDRHHRAMRSIYEEEPDAWILPWAILPEVDYLLLKYLGADIEQLFLDDLVEGRFLVEGHNDRDVARAAELNQQYADLELGLVDAVVIAMAERLRPASIATLDLRDFAAIQISGNPLLIPRDL